MYSAGSCASGFRSFYPGSRLVFSLFLGAAALPGGTLTVTTCGRTANDTVLYVGTGCPSWDLPFGCLAGSDNAGGSACPANAGASAVSLVATQRTYFVQVGGFNGADVTAGLAWAYAPPPTPSRSGSRSRAAASRSRSAAASRSRSRKAK